MFSTDMTLVFANKVNSSDEGTGLLLVTALTAWVLEFILFGNQFGIILKQGLRRRRSMGDQKSETDHQVVQIEEQILQNAFYKVDIKF